MAVYDAPVPFMGSDGRIHLVYELGMTNFFSGNIAVEKVEVLGDGVVLQTLDAAAGAFSLRACANPWNARESTHALLSL
ncbi:MAG: hypothetical protein H0X25_21875 [Acidobacteriales bacterium]|nr:hypothetical protein [Terriglobales bacterium]